MIDFCLNIGDVATYDGPVQYTCYGLGSCVGLFIHDRLTGHSGGAHIFLPTTDYSNFENGKYYSVQSAIDEILSQLKRKGNNLNFLRAKITGGANVIGSMEGPGNDNVNQVVAELRKRNIYLAATDVGGQFSRTAKFIGHTGELNVKVSSIDQTKFIKL